MQFLARRGRAILAGDVGPCKTRQAVDAMNRAAPDGAVTVAFAASLELDRARIAALAA